MDNKQYRNFYWEVKDFMGKPHEINKPVKTPDNMVSSIKNILEQNKLYKPSSFNPNINSASTIRQAINAIERNNQNGTPENIQHTKNITSNPFGLIREGIFDELGQPAKPNKFDDGIIRGIRGGMKELPIKTPQPYIPSAFDGVKMGNTDKLKQLSGNPTLIPPSGTVLPTPKPLPGRPNLLSTESKPNKIIIDRKPARPGEKRPLTSSMPTLTGDSTDSTDSTDTADLDTTDTTDVDSTESTDLSSMDVMTRLKYARGMPRSTPTYNRTATGSSDNREQRRAENVARNAAIKSANISATAARDELKAKWKESRVQDQENWFRGGAESEVSKETIALQSKLRSMNDTIRPGSPQQGNITPADIGARYAKRIPNNVFSREQA